MSAAKPSPSAGDTAAGGTVPGGTPQRTIPGLTPALKARLRLLFRVLAALSPRLAARLALRIFTTPIKRPVDEAEHLFLLGATQRLLPTTSGAIHCYEWAGSGPTVLIVHGWISHTARFAAVIQALQQRGLRVVAFDAPAHGRSAGLRADVRAFQSSIAAVSAAFGPIDGVLAHSFGALNTAAWLAGAIPAHLSADAATRAALPPVRAAVLVGMPRDAQYVLESFTQAIALSPRAAASLRDLLIARYGSAPEQFSATALAAHIHIPVLLVHGDADELVPSGHAHEVAERLVNGQVQIVAGLRHSEPLREPGTVGYMADFLRDGL